MIKKYVIYLHFILILSVILVSVKCDLPDYIKLKRLPDTTFQLADYVELPENERESEDTEYISNDQSADFNNYQSEINEIITSKLDPSIKYDENWTSILSDYGQLSAVDLDLNGNVAVFCRRERVWGQSTFDWNNNFNPQYGPIKDDTIILLNKKGKIILSWGRKMFFLPHGLTIDHLGNYWLTDVGLHQVFKFDNQDIENLFKMLNDKSDIYKNYNDEDFDRTDVLKSSIIKPSLILGKAFEPGDDSERFCKPTSVAVMKNGDFFVADGYCNSRIIKFNSKGERILNIGRKSSILLPYAFNVPHAMALAEEYNYLYIADRENGRIVCHLADNGTFHKEYKHPALGSKIYSIAYTRNHLYIVNGADPYAKRFHVRGFVVDIRSNEIISQFGPNSDMDAPHDIAVSRDGSEIYTVELINHKLYRFLQATSPPNNSLQNIQTINNNIIDSNNGEYHTAETNVTSFIITIVISVIVFVGLCLAVAAVAARCQKRGCLLSRKRHQWASDTKENFKLFDSKQNMNFKIFNKRPNTRDFSKLNTEPESSDEDHLEDSLII